MSTSGKVVIAVLAIALSVVAGVNYLLGSEEVPATTNYHIDLEQLRRLASSGDAMPVQVRVENIATGSLPGALIMAGESFDPITMPRPVFQVVYPDGRYVLIDAAYNRAAHEQLGSADTFSDEAWDTLVLLMESAEQIVVTHEHADHIGGITQHPRPHLLKGRLSLNPEQIDAPRAVDEAVPEAILSELEPLTYEGAVAIAPGVVVQRAAGHTPGSQIVYVMTDDDSEFLFVGDVVWNMDAITALKYRPRLITNLILDEDRAAVLDQIRALRQLHDGGAVHIVVSHDARTFSTDIMPQGFVQGAR